MTPGDFSIPAEERLMTPGDFSIPAEERLMTPGDFSVADPVVATNKPLNKLRIEELSGKLENPMENLGKMLSVVCKDPDNCLALGAYIPMMKRFFNDFRDLSLVDINSLKLLGSPSLNGFVFEIPFKKNEYTSYTVLKSAAKPEADNLFYEYYVGKTFINKYLQQFPVFVETYDCYRYNSHLLASAFKQIAENKIKISNTGITDLNTVITRIDHGDLTSVSEMNRMFEDSCSEPDTICILIQHFNNLTPFKNIFDETSPNYKTNRLDSPYLFYQLYFALSVIGDKYTHYDLHVENVNVYKPYSGQKYILMRYHSNGKVHEFPSEYIVKIIDYGRNYINNGTTTTNEIVSNIICNTPKCNPNCGDQVGYRAIQGDYTDYYNINPIVPNASHDLRVFANLNDVSQPDLWKGRIYKDDFYYEEKYGTPEDLTGDVDHIRSIHDLRAALETTAFPNYNDHMTKKYEGWEQAAIMDVYDDGRDYEFKVI
jgi:hypothetical protein